MFADLHLHTFFSDGQGTPEQAFQAAKAAGVDFFAVTPHNHAEAESNDPEREDNILIAAAVTAALDAIITRNLADFAHSPIPAWDPPELLKRLPGGRLPLVAGAGPSSGVP